MCVIKKKLEIDAQKYTYMIDDSVILTQIVTVEKIEEFVSRQWETRPSYAFNTRAQTLQLSK